MSEEWQKITCVVLDVSILEKPCKQCKVKTGFAACILWSIGRAVQWSYYLVTYADTYMLAGECARIANTSYIIQNKLDSFCSGAFVSYTQPMRPKLRYKTTDICGQPDEQLYK